MEITEQGMNAVRFTGNVKCLYPIYILGNCRNENVEYFDLGLIYKF